MIKQSFCFPNFRQAGQPLLELFEAARAVGYPAVELWQRDENDARFVDVVAAARAAGLVISSMCGHYALKDGMNKRANHARIAAELRESIALAADLGIPGVICFSGNVNPGQTDEDAREACAECLRLVAPLAEARGVSLNLELLNSKVNHPGYQADRTAWGVDVCKRVGSPAAKVLYDIYHMQIMEGDVIRTMRENLAWIGHLHTAGNPGRRDFADPDLPQEMNYRGIARALSAAGYAGYLGHEFSPLGDPIAALRAAFVECDVK